MRKYTPKIAALYTIQVLIFLVSATVTVLAILYLSSFRILMSVLIIICWALATLFGLWLLPMYFRRTVMYLGTGEISIHSGLLFLWREHMKISAVQYVSLIKVPLSGLTGFNFVMVHGLGGTAVLPFLSKPDADEIIAVLNLRISEQ